MVVMRKWSIKVDKEMVCKDYEEEEIKGMVRKRPPVYIMRKRFAGEVCGDVNV